MGMGMVSRLRGFSILIRGFVYVGDQNLGVWGIPDLSGIRVWMGGEKEVVYISLSLFLGV